MRNGLNIFLVFMLFAAIALLASWAYDTDTKTNHMNECVIDYPLVPVAYKSFYVELWGEGPRYTVIYKGHIRWNGEGCLEAKQVNKELYAQAKLIVGE